MLVTLAMTSCKDDFLEVTSPTDTFIEEYYTTKTSLDEALVAAYAPLHWYDYGSTWQYNALNFISEFMSDDMYPNGSSNTDQPMLQLMFNYSCTPVVCLTGVWSDSYSGVKRSNDVIKYPCRNRWPDLLRYHTFHFLVIPGRCRISAADYISAAAFFASFQ